MRSEEARVGARVRVRETYRKPELRGLIGSIKQTYGDRAYRALEVQLEDGRSLLFWYYELEEPEQKLPADRFWRSRRR